MDRKSLLRKIHTFYPNNKITACKGELNEHMKTYLFRQQSKFD
jgi:hypothetical protein